MFFILCASLIGCFSRASKTQSETLMSVELVHQYGRKFLLPAAPTRLSSVKSIESQRQIFAQPSNLLFLQIKELPCELTSINSLVIFLTRFLWHISAHHAAINYPLTDYGAFTLNMPTKLYRDTRVSNDEFSLFNFPNANISAVSVLDSIRIPVSVGHRLPTVNRR